MASVLLNRWWVCMRIDRRLAKIQLVAWVFAAVVSLAPVRTVQAQDFPPKASDIPEGSEARGEWMQTLDRHALVALPLAAALGAVLALRPRRRKNGTPSRSTPVIQTQIILSVIASVVMLVVGSSLARAHHIGPVHICAVERKLS